MAYEGVRKYLLPEVVARLKPLELKAKAIVEGFITGLHKSPYHGFSIEFAEHQPYSKGDNLKAIDWKVFARTERLYIKKYEEETNVRTYVLLDVSDSMCYPTEGISKLEYAVYLSAALIYLLLKQRDAVGLALFDERLREFFPPRSRRSWLIPLLESLDKQLKRTSYFQRTTAIAETIAQMAVRFHRRSFILLITDLFAPELAIEPLVRSIKQLQANKHEVIIFQILDEETEVALNFDNKPVILKDLETAEEIEILPSVVKSLYERRVRSYFQTLAAYCYQWQIDFVPLSIKTPYDKALLTYLTKRKHLY